MDLYELARTVQADKNRAIEAETRRRNLLATSDTSAAAETVKTPSPRQVQPSTSTTAVSR